MDFHIQYQSYMHQYKTKHLAIYHALKDAIVNGQLPYKLKLPSSRELADLYLLSRGTINLAYEMLAAEGYVSSSLGSGTFVAFQHQDKPLEPAPNSAIRLSQWGMAIMEQKLSDKISVDDIRINFGTGLPDLHFFPHEAWSRVMYAQVREMMESLQKEAFVTQGHLPLREAVARHLLRTRGIQATAEDIVILGGSMQGIALITQLLVNPGESVICEYPGYSGFRRVVEAARGKVIEGKVDQWGIQLANWPAQLIFVTPSRQFPTGVVLSLERRQGLLQWAANNSAIIVEDDYDSEFRHHGRPIEPLKVMDTEDRVVYLGTFSKTMHTDLRLGYAVVPTGLREAFLKAKQLIEPHPAAILEQRALAIFMNSGHYERHLRRMKRVYSKRYAVIYAEMNLKLLDLFDFVPSDAGLHLFAWWKGSLLEWNLYKNACEVAGVIWSLGDLAYMEREQRASVCFGFSHLLESEIIEGVAIMRRVADTMNLTSATR
ncbi:PLP-dependent aminotransferase family protein [Paenibacillus psychroresistens]|uniref:PLP-dependent aminotransferase family protein n=2 Tax=Paenibacillus psychroresistens TaxID=1778678 RepID=A0A6B8RVR2_9BACL|nr:PLP-dependent aminotransferase family protein [Paenibacillus psychroresistens]